MKYKHIFFDLDHTLWDFDTNSRQTLEELFDLFTLSGKGISDFDRFHKNYLAHNEVLWAQYRNGLVKVEELRWKRMALALADFGIVDIDLAHEMGSTFLARLPFRKTLFPGTLEILQYLRNKGYLLHLITNGFEATQHSKLKYSGLSEYFVEVITSESSSYLKPNKEIFEFAFGKVKARCHECIMIGDSIEVDIQGAINAGIDQVYVNHLNVEPAVKPTYTVRTLKELEGIF